MSTAPKYNAKEFDDFFKRMIAQTDERIAQVSCGHGVQRDAATSKFNVDAPETPAGIQPSGYVDEDGGWMPDMNLEAK